MKKDNAKRNNKTTFTAREVGVLIEDLKSQFRAFGEDLSALRRRVDAIFEEQGKQKEDIFIIKADINIIKSEVKEIKTRLDCLEEDIRVIKNDIRVIKEDFGKRITHLEEATPK